MQCGSSDAPFHTAHCTRNSPFTLCVCTREGYRLSGQKSELLNLGAGNQAQVLWQSHLYGPFHWKNNSVYVCLCTCTCVCITYTALGSLCSLPSSSPEALTQVSHQAWQLPPVPTRPFLTTRLCAVCWVFF